jgi:carbonic anhydrase/acetyltransferase-like protein (isoleucine patch superfamily)
MIREFNGKYPKIARSAFVSEAAYVVGDVEIGDFSIIGAGAVVAEGMKIPEQSLCTGTPARIKGRVSSQWIAQIKDGAAFYTDLARQYKQQGLKSILSKSGFKTSNGVRGQRTISGYRFASLAG